MVVKDATYELTAFKPEQYPKHNLPEIALVGRSNVGKSSLINVLVNRKNLARESATPGKTRGLNFYNIDHQLYFVDLPGYGYAKVSKAEREFWGRMIETYLNTRNQLNLIIMLVDIRHTPSSDDQMMYQWIIGQDKPNLVVATKLDKIPRGQIQKKLRDIRVTLGLGEGDSLLPFSAETKQGRDEIWNQIRENSPKPRMNTNKRE
ncbi:MAG: YihA family ribosome biogenesis GTP-binding protein [Firmicutes bacterium]|nr:YihA family ribosome biogenesis GTP-binding protein [Bacillota bacterium]